MFEPNRLATLHLVDAYSQIVPLRIRATQSPGLPQRATPSANEASNQGGRS
jgi:hypothetical protein